jgi:GTP cyclohydrolase IB
MRDVQSEHDDRGVAVDRVGITGLRYPLTFTDGELRQAGIADLEMTVQLQADRRGTHMSRMVEIVHHNLTELDPRRLPIVLKAAAHHLDAQALTLRASLPISTLVTAPASKTSAWQVHDLSISGVLEPDSVHVTTTVSSEVTSLCPCSQAISDYGAHNQRSRVTLAAIGDGDSPYPLPVTELIELVRSVGSSPVYPLVKRPDERTITMQAFDHPAFVEDMVRELSIACRRRGIAHRVEVRNFESIHSHDAIATISG